MNTEKFNPQLCQRAFSEKVAAIYGWEPHEKLDGRLMYYLELVADAGELAAGRRLVDLGPGTSAFGPVARAMGMEVTLVDDFGGGGGVNRDKRGESIRTIDALRDGLGIRVVELDFVAQPLPLESGSADVITCFHSLEHWHNSPKKLFAEVARVLRPGGHLIIATPNAVNLRKRISVPLGVSNYGTLEEWYHDGDPVYRGHVREPTVRDLHRLLEWNGFAVAATHGRNFIGRDSIALRFLPRPLRHALAISSDWLIRLFPTLCSDIHVIGRKPS